MQLDQIVSTCSSRPVVDQRPRVPVQQPVSTGQNRQVIDRYRLSNVHSDVWCSREPGYVSVVPSSL